MASMTRRLFRAEEMGIEMVDFKHMGAGTRNEAMDEIEDKDSVTIPNIWHRAAPPPARGLEIPSGSPLQVVKELRRTPPRSKQGFTVFFTGFSVQIHHQRTDGQADGDGRPPGDAARW